MNSFCRYKWIRTIRRLNKILKIVIIITIIVVTLLVQYSTVWYVTVRTVVDSDGDHEGEYEVLKLFGGLDHEEGVGEALEGTVVRS